MRLIFLVSLLWFATMATFSYAQFNPHALLDFYRRHTKEIDSSSNNSTLAFEGEAGDFVDSNATAVTVDSLLSLNSTATPIELPVEVEGVL